MKHHLLNQHLKSLYQENQGLKIFGKKTMDSKFSAVFANPLNNCMKFLPTMSHERDKSNSSSSAFDSSVLKTPIRLPSCLNLRVIARVSTSSVGQQNSINRKMELRSDRQSSIIYLVASTN
jgi:hypothetical protein